MNVAKNLLKELDPKVCKYICYATTYVSNFITNHDCWTVSEQCAAMFNVLDDISKLYAKFLEAHAYLTGRSILVRKILSRSDLTAEDYSMSLAT